MHWEKTSTDSILSLGLLEFEKHPLLLFQLIELYGMSDWLALRSPGYKVLGPNAVRIGYKMVLIKLVFNLGEV